MSFANCRPFCAGLRELNIVQKSTAREENLFRFVMSPCFSTTERAKQPHSEHQQCLPYILTGTSSPDFRHTGLSKIPLLKAQRLEWRRIRGPWAVWSRILTKGDISVFVRNFIQWTIKSNKYLVWYRDGFISTPSSHQYHIKDWNWVP